MPTVKITKETWPKLIEIVRKKANKKVPIWKCIREYYNVCTVSLVTDLSQHLWHLYNRINGTKNETYESYGQLPAFWVHACDIIDNEIIILSKD